MPNEYSIQLDMSAHPPVFTPKSTNCNEGDTILFSTSDGSTQQIGLTGPSGRPEYIDITTDTPWVAPDTTFDWGLTYAYKGGTSTGNINVSMGSGDGHKSQ